MSDSLNNKELVAVGHQFAKAMSSDTAIIDIAKILSRLAERLDCTTAALRETQKQRDALAAENAALKSAAEFATAPDMWEDMGGNVMRYQYKEWYADKLKSAIQAPATDAFLAEVRAQGADECVRQLVISDEDGFSDAPNVCAMVAHQLRQEANTENPSLLSSEDCQAFVQAFTKGAAS